MSVQLFRAELVPMLFRHQTHSHTLFQSSQEDPIVYESNTTLTRNDANNDVDQEA